MASRMERLKCVVNCIEGVHVFSKNTLEIPRGLKRKHFAGTTGSNIIGPVNVAPWEESWRISPDAKKALYGPGGKILTGGAVVDGQKHPEFNDKRDPASYHLSPLQLHEEYLHSFAARAVCHATVVDACFPMACIHAKVPYVGICFTEAHKQLLEAELVSLVWNECLKETSAIYEPLMHRPKFKAD